MTTLGAQLSETFRLYGRYAGISLRSQMQYRFSFVMMTAGNFLVTAIEFLGIWALFHRFGQLRGWTLAEVAFFYGTVNIAFAIAEGLGRGFDTFPRLVKSGDVDRLLLRPRSVAFQVAAQDLQLMRVGRLFQALLVLGWSVSRLGGSWTPARIALILAIIGGTSCLFYGLLILQATLSFWTIETLEIMNTVTHGGTETAQYPIAIYRPWFRRFFTFVVPIACTGYFPAEVVLNRPGLAAGSPWPWLAPFVGVLFLWVSLQAWKVGVAHYRSTGS
ncbi:MAG: ABC-2 family transporter protein [Chloroflexi bacterium]|nr:ABC-2 family transporter protein [Chloroflexota bacterium]